MSPIYQLMKISTFLPPPGHKRQTMIDIDGLPGLPATFIGGIEDGPTVLVVSGVHGGEYVAIQTLVELAQELEPSQVIGRIIMFHPVNPQGFQERRATVLPEDGHNINSLFYDGSYNGPAAAITRAIAELQSISNFYLDLHTADLHEETSPLVCYPATGDDAITQASRRAALMVDAPAMIKSTMPGAGITESAKRGLPVLLIKRGDAGGTCRRAEIDLYKKDVINVLRHLGVLSGIPKVPLQSPEELEPVYLRSPQPGLWLPSVSVGQTITVGQKLGLITDFFGNILENFTTRKNGLVLYGLQALSANAGDILLALGYTDGQITSTLDHPPVQT